MHLSIKRTVIACLGLLFLGWTLIGPSAFADEQPSSRLQLGINVAEIVDWGPKWVFLDAFQASRKWFAQRPNGQGPWDTGESIETDPHGWPLLKPGQAAATLMFRETGCKYPAGYYLCTFEGSGEISFDFDATIVRQREGAILLDVKPSDQGILMRIDASDPKDPIRNIHVWLPGFQEMTGPFHPDWLQRIRPFKTIRFMGWQRINGNDIETWPQRTTPADARQSTGRGVAIEYMVQVCNLLEADPWFCMPHKADDDFVRRFALLVREKLDPARKVYIEYSNEVWNGQFRQARYCMEQGQKLRLSSNPAEAKLRYQARRSVEIFRIWESVFGGTDRLVRVLSGQTVNPWVIETQLAWIRAYRHADAIAVAAYFSYGDASVLADRESLPTVDELLDLAEKNLHTLENHLAAHRKIANRYGVKLLAYEGGQHLVGTGKLVHDPQVTSLMIAANEHPRMYDLYRQLFDIWRRQGDDPLMLFLSIRRPNKWGSWGMLTWQDQPVTQAPKYRAAMDELGIPYPN